jgi:hypothetical protein
MRVASLYNSRDPHPSLSQRTRPSPTGLRDADDFVFDRDAVGAAFLARHRVSIASIMQLCSSACLIIVVLTHIVEAPHFFLFMGRGEELATWPQQMWVST